MSHTTSTLDQPTSRWRLRLAALGPGLLTASAAIGASHLVSSTQAGALFGWQMGIVLILALVLKYPFFRFGPQYTAESGRSLVEGYARKGKGYLIIFFLLVAVSSVISTAGVTLLGTVILSYLLPDSWGLSVSVLAIILIVITWVLLVGGRYKALDGITKVIVATLSVSTVIAVIAAASQGAARTVDFVPTSPWTLATLPFLVALVGWMPAPIELSALNSLWVKAKRTDRVISARDVMFDFHTGYITSAVLAIFFLALGVLVQYGSGEEMQMAGGSYIPQLLSMYGDAIGQWAVPLIGLIAFSTMFGTIIAVVDGYARACAESLRLLRGQPELSRRATTTWISILAFSGLVIVVWMSGGLATMLRFAMISAFITAPVFGWLNFVLIKGEQGLSRSLTLLAYAGLIFLGGVTVIFLLNQVGVLG